MYIYIYIDMCAHVSLCVSRYIGVYIFTVAHSISVSERSPGCSPARPRRREVRGFLGPSKSG